jgi:hypothetical protein
MLQTPSLAGLAAMAAAGTMTVSVLASGQAWASALPRDAGASQVPAATPQPGDQAGRTGRFRFTGGGSRIGIRLKRVRWTSYTRASGTVWWNQVSGRVWARLTIAGPGGATASVRLWYFDYVRHSAARLSGRYRGRRIAATMPAP